VPWREASVIEERTQFVVLASKRDKPVTELCREFGISRQTGYTWMARYRTGGVSQMMDRSRRPLKSPGRTATEIEQAVIEVRRQCPDWGAPKLRKVVFDQHPEWNSVSVRTVHRILDRHQLIAAADRHRPAVTRFERGAPNELWQMDFKGPQGFNTDKPVGPLSMLDDHSRFLIDLYQLGSTKMAGVRSRLEQAFEVAGVPEAILIDHGTPWWNPINPWGITELSVWMMQQGIRLLYSAFRHPETQGKVERMHGSLQRAVWYRKANPDDQQWLDSFRHEYNHSRPHEALDMAAPADRWHPSPRTWQRQIRDWDYAESMQVVRLAGEGQLGWRNRRWEISNALRGQVVGIEIVGARAIVYFCNTPIRELDLETGTSVHIPADVARGLRTSHRNST
jgi:transposase InsO family protein